MTVAASWQYARVSATVEDFMRDGFVALRSAVPDDLVVRCRREITSEMARHGVDVSDSSTWSQPVVRLNCPETPPFAAAGTQSILWRLYDALLGPGTWWPRQGVGGTIAVRFPSVVDPGDAGWHVDGSYEGSDGELRLNVASKARGLLCLFLFSDVSVDDAPTELKIGSHLDVPPLLAPFGDEGEHFVALAERLGPKTFNRPSAFAEGRAGDVFVCHPFLVHRATWPHRGAAPRIVAQPGVALHEPFSLTGHDPLPVERAILQSLRR
jgi:hypothetical protein